jgi:poly-gamma-glutamate capsule biosynthesis protein CapA/YwtB (metallophosphatase superfamily)
VGSRGGTILASTSVALLIAVLAVAFVGDRRAADGDVLGKVGGVSLSAADTSATDTGATSTASPSTLLAPVTGAPTTTLAPTTETPATVAPTTEPGPIATTTTLYDGPIRVATLAFTGDIMAHSEVTRYASINAGGISGYDFGPMFEAVAPELSAADLAICHLETTLSASAQPQGFPVFRAPGEMATAIEAAGYDGCSVASNHSYDYGEDGVISTLDVLDDAGLEHTGTARTLDEARKTTLYDAAGIRVAHLSYTYGLNVEGPGTGAEFQVNLIDAATIIDDAIRARRAGADFVVASLHWGVEYEDEPSEDQVALAQVLADESLLDLVIGHHAHHIQPVSKVGDLWVAYGLGNFLSNQTPGCCGIPSEDGVILTVTIVDTPTGVEIDGMTFTSTWVDRAQMKIMPTVSSLTLDGFPSWYQAVLQNSYDRTVAAVTAFDPTGALSLTPTTG